MRGGMRNDSFIVRVAAAAMFAFIACSGCDSADCEEGQCTVDSGPVFDARPGDATADVPVDGALIDAGTDSTDAPSFAAASLRFTEINPASQNDLIELFAARGGALDGIHISELTNSGFAFSFPAGYTVAAGDIIVLHLGGDCTDDATDPQSCGESAPFSDAWDFGAPGSLTYSGKVLELFSADDTAMDGAPFVESHGVAPGTYVAAVKQIQADGVWDATACVDDPSTGLAKDRYCRNISVLWDDLADDNSTSVTRITGDDALSVPGNSGQWSAALPATFGTYPVH